MNLEEPCQEISLHDIPTDPPQPRQSNQIRALTWKLWHTHRNSFKTTLCQILTPILCLLFTVLITMIVNNSISTQIANPSFPQLLNVPGIYSNKTQYITTCDQYYYYTANGTSAQNAHHLLSKAMTKYCPATHDNRPQFYPKPTLKTINTQILSAYKQADNPSSVTEEDATLNIPDGVIVYNEITRQNLSVVLTINDMRMGRYHRSNGVTRLLLNNSQKEDKGVNSYIRVTEGGLSLMDLVTKTYLNSYKHDEMIVSSFMYMPFSQENSFVNRCINVIGNSLYPMGLSLLIPIMLYSLVSERESRLLEMMTLNGLLPNYYWLVNYFQYVFLSLGVFSVFFLFGRVVFGIQLFVSSSWVLLGVLMMGWGFCQVSFACVLQMLMQKSRSALIVGYCIAIFATLVGEIMSTMVYPSPSLLPAVCLMFPPFALSRMFYLMSFACSNGSCYGSINAISGEMIACLTAIYAGILAFPVALSLTSIYEKYTCSKRRRYTPLALQQSKKPFQDPSVQNERELVQRLFSQQMMTPLLINDLQKQFGSQGDSTAFHLQPTFLNVNEREVFGLLGPSGSGKTTLLSLITGSLNPTSGFMLLDGQDPSDIKWKEIGFCPQFDLLWPELTPVEHLSFYLRLKGVTQKQLEQTLTQMLSEVDLLADKDRPVRSLSGGMKRRLSIAIALGGNPRLVILDEPASGLDPEHRRQLWDIILKYRRDTAIVLTTHSLEEATVLCNRVGILVDGVMRCVGKVPDLKSRLGKGYNLTINFKKMGDEEVLLCIQEFQRLAAENSIPLGSQRQFHQSMNYQLDKSEANFTGVLRLVNKHKESLNIEDWCIQQPSLYDVFMTLIDESEA